MLSDLACVDLETVCSGGADEDCDGLTDCLDPDCDGTTACAGSCTTIDVCGNLRDDDCDGLTDCADPDCARDPSCLCGPGPRPSTEVDCTNAVDDDCDGRTDCLDSDCTTNLACDTTCGRNIGSREGIRAWAWGAARGLAVPRRVGELEEALIRGRRGGLLCFSVLG